MTADRFQEILSQTDPSVAKTGSSLLLPKMRQHFSSDFLQLLEDTRMAWVSVLHHPLPHPLPHTLYLPSQPPARANLLAHLVPLTYFRS
jgi:hypothetical protein